MRALLSFEIIIIYPLMNKKFMFFFATKNYFLPWDLAFPKTHTNKAKVLPVKYNKEERKV
jgi:hypothetical protein